MKNHFLIGFLIILCISACSKKNPIQISSVAVSVAKPLIQDTPIYKDYIGQTEASIKVEVKSQVQGLLTDVLFTQGQQVKKGDLIVKIDTRPYEAELAKAEAALAHHTANLHYAEITEKRYAKLLQENYISKMQYDQCVTDILTSKASLLQAQADIQTAKINISYCNISSPIDAIAGYLQVDAGNLIKNVEVTPIVVLNQISPIYAYFSIPQQDLPKIQKMQNKASLEVLATLNSEHSISGTLDLINNELDENTGTVWLRAVFQNENQILWPKEFVDIRLILETKKNALLVPIEAIQIGQIGHFAFVVNPESQIAELKKVEIGQRMDNHILINSGLNPDDLVVIEGQINLSSGTKVLIKNQGIANEPL